MIPAGLIDKNVELFAVNDKLMAQYNGSVLEFFNLPKSIIDKYIDEMLKYPEKVKCLYNMGFFNLKEMVYQYCWCNYGGYDKTPDLVTNNNLFYTEYWDCGKRESCPYQFKLCNRIIVGNVSITKREIEIIKEIASGDPDKIIADRLGITFFTLNAHKKSIYEKLNTHSQSEVTAFALRHNLIE